MKKEALKMNKNIKVYDINGELLKDGDKVTDEYQFVNELKVYWDEWYLTSDKSIWSIEQFSLSVYKDGVKLNDFIRKEMIK